MSNSFLILIYKLLVTAEQENFGTIYSINFLFVSLVIHVIYQTQKIVLLIIRTMLKIKPYYQEKATIKERFREIII